MMAIFFPHSHFSFCRPLFLFCSCFLFHSHAPFGFCFRFGAVVVVSGGGISFYSVCVATDTFGRWRTRCFFFIRAQMKNINIYVEKNGNDWNVNVL